MNRRLGEKLTSLVDAAGFTGKGGRERFRQLLGTKLQPIPSQSTLYYWLSGARTPELPKLRALLDLLVVTGKERDEIVGLVLPEGLLSGNRPTDDELDHPSSAS